MDKIDYKKMRKTLLINPKFQFSVLGFMTLVAVGVMIIFYGADYFFFWRLTGEGQKIGLPPDHVFFQFIHEQQHMMNLIFVVTALISTAVIALCGLVLSHRVAGPLFRMRRHLDDVASGKTSSDMHFRDKDYFGEVADAFNRMMAKYRADTGKVEKKDAA
jgi:HAMP domain-containing protein